MHWFLRWPVLAIMLMWGSGFPYSLRQDSLKVAGDGFGYYLYVRAFVVHGDFHVHAGDAVPTELNATSRTYQEFTLNVGKALGGGRLYSQYPVGVSLFWMPLMTVVHGGLKVLHAVGFPDVPPADGFSYPYRYSTFFSTALGGLAGLLMAFSVTEKLVGPASALLAIVAGFYGSPLRNYIFTESSMSEAPTFFTVTLSIWLWWRRRYEQTFLNRCWLGLSIGLATIMRYQNAFLLLLPAYDLFRSAPSLRRRTSAKAKGELRSWCWNGAALFLGFAVMVLIQVFVWRASTGVWSPPPYSTGIDSWMKWRPGMLLWSARKGLLAAHPLWLFGLAGLAVYLRKETRLVLALLAFFVFLVWLNQLPFDYWGGGGFGSRRFVPLSLALVVGLGIMIESGANILRRWPRLFVGLLTVPFVWLSIKSEGDMTNNPTISDHGVPQMPKLVWLLQKKYVKAGWPFSWPANLMWAKQWKTTPDRFDLGATYYIDAPDFVNPLGPGRYRVPMTHPLARNIIFEGATESADRGVIIRQGHLGLWVNLCRSPRLRSASVRLSRLGPGPCRILIKVNQTVVVDEDLGAVARDMAWNGSLGNWNLGTNLLEVNSGCPVLLEWVEVVAARK